jgi:hypothetical protein
MQREDPLPAGLVDERGGAAGKENGVQHCGAAPRNGASSQVGVRSQFLQLLAPPFSACVIASTRRPDQSNPTRFSAFGASAGSPKLGDVTADRDGRFSLH